MISKIGAAYAGIVLHFVRRAGTDQLAVDQDRDAIGQAEDGSHVMLDEQNGDVTGEMLDQFDHARRLLGAGAGHWLVEEQQLRSGGQRHGQFQRPLLAMRQLAGDNPGFIAQADLLEIAARFVEPGGFRMHRPPEAETAAGVGAALHGQHDIVERREAEKDVGDLIGTGHAGAHPLVHAEPGNVVAGKMHAAGIRLQGTRNMVDESCLAGAIGADQGMHLAGLHAEIDRLERIDGGEAAGELANVEQAQERMKAANKAIRTHKTEETRIAALVAQGLTEAQAAELLKPDFAGRVGFPSYALSNNNANARRIAGRIAELEKRRQRVDVEQEAEGYTYREDTTENRVMFIFDGKPDEATRAILKREAFKWSPSRGAWVRQLNNAGIWISPPPPTAESISPATNAMAPKNNNSSITMSPRHAGRRSAQERETSGLSTRTSKHLSFNRPGIRRPSPALAASR